jgi:hypothetical protein
MWDHHKSNHHSSTHFGSYRSSFCFDLRVRSRLLYQEASPVKPRMDGYQQACRQSVSGPGAVEGSSPQDFPMLLHTARLHILQLL